MDTQRAKVIAVLVVLIGAAAILLIAYSVSVYLPRQGAVAPVASSTQQTSGQIPPPSGAVMQQLETSNGFQAFVFIADSGFMPSTTTIKAGQTVRFANKSSHDVWIGQITAQNTPSNPDTHACSAPFNVCHALHPGDFVELTFPAKGTFRYMDDLNPAKRGAVIVK